MKKVPQTIARLMFLLAGSTALLCVAGCNSKSTEASSGSPADGVAWSEDLGEALKVAARENKPVMVDFFATWCGPCKAMDRQTYTDATVITQLTNWVAVRIDVDRQSALAQQYAIQAVPTIILLRPDGQAPERMEGFASAHQLGRALENYRGKLNSLTNSTHN